MYSLEQLEDALEHIDKGKYPERVEQIKYFLENPGPRSVKAQNKKGFNSDASNKWLVLLGSELFFWIILIALGSVCYSLW